MATDQTNPFGPLVSRRRLLAGAAAAAGVAGLAACSAGLPLPVTPTGGPTSAGTPRSAPAVRFVTLGASFSPSIELTEGSTADVQWLDEDGTQLATGTDPTIQFGSAVPRSIYLVTTYADVVTVNLGFNVYDDAGRYQLHQKYNKAAESVSGVEGLGVLVNLRRLMAANGPLTGTLDLSGLGRLEFVECFHAQVEDVVLTGCDALVRLCLEQNRLKHLDLNPVAATLRDLRAAAQQGGALTFAELTLPLAALYHFCVRDQVIGNDPTATQLPVCEELWNWNTGQSGAVPTPASLRSLMSRGNHYTTADFTGLFTDVDDGEIDLENNELTSLTVTGCRSLRSMRFRWNNLTTATVDAVLDEVASWRTQGTTLLLDGDNQPPSSTGMQQVAALRALGWEVEVSSP